jgi:hypothetical protein
LKLEHEVPLCDIPYLRTTQRFHLLC